MDHAVSSSSYLRRPQSWWASHGSPHTNACRREGESRLLPTAPSRAPAPRRPAARPREASGASCADKVMRAEGGPSRRGLAGGTRLPGRAGPRRPSAAAVGRAALPAGISLPAQGEGWRERGHAFLPRRRCHGERRATRPCLAAHSKGGGGVALPAAGRFPPREGGREAPPAREPLAKMAARGVCVFQARVNTVTRFTSGWAPVGAILSCSWRRGAKEGRKRPRSGSSGNACGGRRGRV